MRDKITKLLMETGRDGMEDLLGAMDVWGFFEAPCSGGNHLCKPGGLAEHSLNVFETAMTLAQALPGVDMWKLDSVAISALLHDLGKVGDYGRPMYVENILKSGKQSESKPYKRNPDLTAVPHAVRSIKLATLYIDLTEDEEWAILTHDGLYDFMKYDIKGHETWLSLIIHWADMWSSHILEGAGGADE